VTITVPVADKEVTCGTGSTDTAVRDLLDVSAGLGADCDAFQDAPVGEHPTIGLSSRVRYVPRRHALRFVLTCPRRYKQRSCKGRLSAKLGRRAGHGFASRRFRIKRRHHKALLLHISRRQRRALRRGSTLRVVVSARDRRHRPKRTTRLLKRKQVRGAASAQLTSVAG
jgi:hypothetical protein